MQRVGGGAPDALDIAVRAVRTDNRWALGIVLPALTLAQLRVCFDCDHYEDLLPDPGGLIPAVSLLGLAGLWGRIDCFKVIFDRLPPSPNGAGQALIESDLGTIDVRYVAHDFRGDFPHLLGGALDEEEEQLRPDRAIIDFILARQAAVRARRRWLYAGRVIGRLSAWWSRSQHRVYCPGGAGFAEAQLDFEMRAAAQCKVWHACL